VEFLKRTAASPGTAPARANLSTRPLGELGGLPMTLPLINPLHITNKFILTSTFLGGEKKDDPKVLTPKDYGHAS
jgi:hypothetical protein